MERKTKEEVYRLRDLNNHYDKLNKEVHEIKVRRSDFNNPSPLIAIGEWAKVNRLGYYDIYSVFDFKPGDIIALKRVGDKFWYGFEDKNGNPTDKEGKNAIDLAETKLVKVTAVLPYSIKAFATLPLFLNENNLPADAIKNALGNYEYETRDLEEITFVVAEPMEGI